MINAQSNNRGYNRDESQTQFTLNFLGKLIRMNDNYSIVIQWSEKDSCFVATLPEWDNQNTHGESYEQALDNAQKVLRSLINSFKSQGQPLPEAATFQIPSAIS